MEWGGWGGGSGCGRGGGLLKEYDVVGREGSRGRGGGDRVGGRRMDEGGKTRGEVGGVGGGDEGWEVVKGEDKVGGGVGGRKKGGRGGGCRRGVMGIGGGEGRGGGRGGC